MKLFKTYYKPTPAKFRKAGDLLLALSTFLTTYAVADEWGKGLSITILLIGAIGKFLTNFFAESK